MAIIKILLDALDGVIDAPNDVSWSDEELVENEFVLLTETTCNTLPAGIADVGTEPVRFPAVKLLAVVNTVPASSGSVSVLLVFVAGEAKVNTPVPVAAP